MSVVKNVWVFAEKKDAILELCAGAKTLGQKVSVLWIGSKGDTEEMIHRGADHIYWLGEIDPGKMLEDYTLTIHDLIAKAEPALVLFSTSKRCKLIAGRLAARLKTSVLTDVMEFVQDEAISAKRMVYGGAAIRTEKSVSPTVLATVGLGVYEKSQPDTASSGTMDEVDFIEPNAVIKRIERKSKQGESVNLAAAKKVIAVGRGLANQDDLNMIQELAQVLGAEIGCTRPMAEGVNWLPRERYIGVSGVMFKPEVYIGIGISGQIQHMVGCNQARTIVAINKDKAAPIFKQADYGLVADLYKVVPILIEKLKAMR